MGESPPRLAKLHEVKREPKALVLIPIPGGERKKLNNKKANKYFDNKSQVQSAGIDCHGEHCHESELSEGIRSGESG